MLNFDKDRFVKIQSGAVAIAKDVRVLMRDLLDGGLERIFFMGTGGVQFLTLPAIELARNRTLFPVSAAYSAQVVLEPPAGLDEKALVVLPSLSGTTKESVQLLAFLKERGVKTLSLTGHKDTPLGRDADYNFTNFAEDDTSSESFYLQTLLIVLALLAERGEYADFDATVAELALLPKLLVSVKEGYEAEAAALAKEIKDETYHIFTGAGSVWPEAHYYGMCILEEMQWIRTRPVQASDFFHGTLELVEPGVSLFIFKGEDAFRPLTDRVENFAKRYTSKVRVLDAASANLPGISAKTRGLISPIILVSALNVVQVAILNGLQRFKTIARLNMIIGGLMIASVPVGLYLQGLTGSFIALGCAYLAGCLITAPAVAQALKARGVPLAFRGALSQWPLITRYAIPALLASLLYEPVNWICTTIVVGNPGGLQQVGLYFIAMQLETLLLFAPQIVVQVTIPMLSTGFGEANRRRVLSMLAMSIGTNLVIAICFVTVMMLFGDWFLVLFKLDPAQHWPLFMIVVFASAMIAGALPLGQVPVSSGYMWAGLSITGGWAATFIIGTWFLQDYGALGMVIARTIAWSLQTLIYIGFTRFAINRSCRTPTMEQSPQGIS